MKETITLSATVYYQTEISVDDKQAQDFIDVDDLGGSTTVSTPKSMLVPKIRLNRLEKSSFTDFAVADLISSSIRPTLLILTFNASPQACC